MAFSAQDVKNLREKTGCGMMDCKKALTESNGDMDKAIEFLREKGLAAAAKKADRIAADGLVVSKIDADKKIGVVLEVNAETDFVAKNEKFVKFVDDVAATIVAENPASVEELLTKPCADTGMTVEEDLREKIQTIWFPMSMAAARSALWFSLTPMWQAKRALRSTEETSPCRLRQLLPSTWMRAASPLRELRRKKRF